jgi:hypothetical protein
VGCRPRRNVDQQANDQQHPPQRKDAQKSRAKKGERSRRRRRIFFMQRIADEKSADDVEEDHGASADETQPPGSVGCQSYIMKNAALGVPKNDATGQK